MTLKNKLKDILIDLELKKIDSLKAIDLQMEACSEWVDEIIPNKKDLGVTEERDTLKQYSGYNLAIDEMHQRKAQSLKDKK